jgi:hypothetical protein
MTDLMTTPAELREWASEQGLPIATKGRIPEHYKTGYAEQTAGNPDWRAVMDATKKDLDVERAKAAAENAAIPATRRPRKNTLKLDFTKLHDAEVLKAISGKEIVWQSTTDPEVHWDTRVVAQPNPANFRYDRDRNVIHFVGVDGFRSVEVNQIRQINR